ncbi:MAG: PTS sugar transporter subunit IIA [Saccharothrix sp.]|nr:PTS sugar transporter subunit IIA [Saccharothrix sp.]
MGNLAELLTADAVRLGRAAGDRAAAIDQVGAVLVEIGAVAPDYVAAMHEREASVSTFIGEGVAIPHGTNASRAHVRRTALTVVQFPDGVDWGGHDVRLCVGIAARDTEQVGVLSALARVLMVPEQAAELREAPDADTVLRILRTVGTDEETTR